MRKKFELLKFKDKITPLGRYQILSDGIGCDHCATGIELCFEGVRFYDLRRWKKAIDEFNKPIIGWDIDQDTAAAYYRQKVLYTPQFTQRDYLWPIGEQELLVNKNIKQNPGW